MSRRPRKPLLPPDEDVADYELTGTESTGEPLAEPTAPAFRCPLPDTHDKLEEAHYFLHQTVNNYHLPEPFRWNLGAFLQALKSVREILRSELGGRAGFKAWFQPHEDALQSDVLIKRFGQGRDLLVHRKRLSGRSTAELGAFKGEHVKLGMVVPVSIDTASADILYHFASGAEGNFPWVDYESGQLLGVRRHWVLDDLADAPDDLIRTCHIAFCRVGTLVGAGHEWLGTTFDGYSEHDASHLPAHYDLLLETQLEDLETPRTRLLRQPVVILSRRIAHSDIVPRVVTHEAPLADRDSGWRMFEGSEPEAWLKDTANFSDEPLGAVAAAFPAVARLFENERLGTWVWDERAETYALVDDAGCPPR